MGVSMTGKPRNGSPPTLAIAFEFHPRERNKSTPRIAKTAAIPRASRRTFRDAFISEIEETFYTLNAPEQARFLISRVESHSPG
jgi:hypothetical protein